METKQAIQKFLISCQAKNLSHKTIKWYRWILTDFAKQMPELPQTPEEIEGFLINCHGGDETRHGYYRALKCFYNFLDRKNQKSAYYYSSKRNGHNNPMIFVSPPRRRHKLPRALTPDELNRLLSSPHPDKIKTLLVFLADTGARIGEAANLKSEDLSQTPWGYVAIIRGKTGQRIAPIGGQTYHLLKGNLPFLCTTDTLSHKVTEAFKAAGLNGTAHTLRHTFATLWAGSEFALQQILGHSSFQTLKIYRQMRMEYLCQQHHQFSPIRGTIQSRLLGI